MTSHPEGENIGEKGAVVEELWLIGSCKERRPCSLGRF